MTPKYFSEAIQLGFGDDFDSINGQPPLLRFPREKPRDVSGQQPKEDFRRLLDLVQLDRS